MKIAIFYHTLFFLGDSDHPLEAAETIVTEQMESLECSGLLAAASELHVGVNGGTESIPNTRTLLPLRFNVKYHGLQCRNECRTILMLEEWSKTHTDWFALYFHTKGATHPVGDPFSAKWRHCMERHSIHNWRQCVADLKSGYEAVGSHWMVPPKTPLGQHIFAGTFFWSTGAFMATLPSILERDRIKVSGLDSLDSRYEAEVWLGNGPRLPKVKDYHPDWDPSKTATCAP